MDLKELRLHSDGSIRTNEGKFASKSGIIPGTPGVDAAETYLSDQGYTVMDREVSVRSEDGTLRRYDIVVSQDGTYYGIEVKSGSATRTRQQRQMDTLLRESGGMNTVGRYSGADSVKISDYRVVYVDRNQNVVSFGLD